MWTNWILLWPLLCGWIGSGGTSLQRRGGALSEGTHYTRCQWRQVSQDRSAPPERVTMTIKQTQIAEIYYSTCSSISKHNRYRQDDRRIEKKIETKDWSVRVNLSIFAMIAVDTWLVYKQRIQKWNNSAKEQVSSEGVLLHRPPRGGTS